MHGIVGGPRKGQPARSLTEERLLIAIILITILLIAILLIAILLIAINSYYINVLLYIILFGRKAGQGTLNSEWAGGFRLGLEASFYILNRKDREMVMCIIIIISSSIISIVIISCALMFSSEGGMIRLETLIELKCPKSSFSSSLSCCSPSLVLQHLSPKP